MFCAISGEVPELPVVSKKSGNVFEKRLIMKYLADTGKDPVTGEEMTTDDLIELKLTHNTVKPRPPTVNSLPSLLSLLQNEWDSVMLETYNLKQQYAQLRQELSNSLYENDAAKRVIARLVKERDEARAALASVKAELGNGGDAMDVDSLGPEVMKKIEETSAALQQMRKGLKKKTPNVVAAESVASYTPIVTIPSLHSTSPAGIVAMDVYPFYTGHTNPALKDTILTGGKDGNILLVSWPDKSTILATAKTGAKVNTLKWHDAGSNAAYNGTFISGGADSIVRVWNSEQKDGGWNLSNVGTWKGHDMEVTSLSVHPTGDYVASAGADSKWAFWDLKSGKALSTVAHDAAQGFTKIEFHPDGMILGTGDGSSAVHVWDLKRTDKPVQSVGGHSGKITALSFSELGYLLATASAGDSAVKVWDLRKMTEALVGGSDEGGAGVSKAVWDRTGQYLAEARHNIVRVYANKTFERVAQFNDVHSGEITGLKFGEGAKHIFTSGLDKKVVVLGSKN
ncbi:WD40-repeat-containing domain protein [Cladochytrium replicatum]|nr:WD40-repeat-containing domain protein [Cladochytrium replicatum]